MIVHVNDVRSEMRDEQVFDLVRNHGFTLQDVRNELIKAALRYSDAQAEAKRREYLEELRRFDECLEGEEILHV